MKLLRNARKLNAQAWCFLRWKDVAPNHFALTCETHGVAPPQRIWRSKRSRHTPGRPQADVESSDARGRGNGPVVPHGPTAGAHGNDRATYHRPGRAPPRGQTLGGGDGRPRTRWRSSTASRSLLKRRGAPHYLESVRLRADKLRRTQGEQLVRETAEALDAALELELEEEELVVPEGGGCAAHTGPTSESGGALDTSGPALPHPADGAQHVDRS